MSLVSVVLPAYNVAPWVGEAVESALAQDHSELELIVIDDGSTDGTWDVLRSWAGHPRVLLERQFNGGPSGSRNTALAKARGTYVAFLDADDRWKPNKVSRHVAVMEAEPDLDLTFSWWQVIDDAGRDTGRRGRPAAGRYGFADLVRENITGTASTVIARRSAIEAAGGFDPTLRANVDLDLWLRIAARRPRNLACIPELLVDYRQRPGQIVSDWARMERNWRTVLDKARAIDPAAVAEVEAEAQALYARYVSCIAYQAGDWGTAREKLAAAWRTAPATIAADRRSWLTTAAVLATLLPSKWHDRLVGMAKAARVQAAVWHA